MGLIINVPVDLAREIFRESGDLQFARFPATMALVDSIGKALNIGHDESVAHLKPRVLGRTRKTKVSQKRLLNNYPLLTR